jgi:DNA-binding MarR family transcriptional regulator
MNREPAPVIVADFIDIFTQFAEALRPAKLPELTLAQINILNDLDLLRPTSPTELARARGVTRSAISQSMTRLVNLGLVWKQRCQRDRRYVELRLTPQGDRLRRLPSAIDPERVRDLLWRMDVDLRYAVKVSLVRLEQCLAAALGRDLWAEKHRLKREVQRRARVWAEAPPLVTGPGGRPAVRLAYR